MRHLLYLVVVSLFFLPTLVYGSVTINEVAWMGGTVSANHEWIELYNSGRAAVSLAGWTLSDGMNLTIPLTGEIGSGAYAVLERTSEESAPGAAWLIYTGALVNTGATLVLRDGTGGVMDQVAGGENWQNIGGDNVTKETAQYTNSGWVTDTPTPGTSNRSGRIMSSSESPERAESPVVAKPTVQKAASTDKSVTVLSRDGGTELTLAISGQSTAYVRQRIPFAASVSGVGTTIKNSLIYTWNFGDSYTEHGVTVDHAYEYPGTYVVTLQGAYARHDEVVRHEITVLPVMVSVARAETGDILLHNDALYDVDISGYRLVGTKEIVLPPHTIILPKGTLTIAAARVGAEEWQRPVLVYDAAGVMVANTATTVVTEPATAATVFSAGLITERVASVAKVSTDEPEDDGAKEWLTPHLPPANAASATKTPILTSTETIPDEQSVTNDAHTAYGLLFVLLFGVSLFILLAPRKSTMPLLPNQK